jgi:hypothetical protein
VKAARVRAIGVERLVPLLLGDLLDRSRVKYSGVVDQDVQAAKGAHRPLDHSFNVSLLRNVGSDRDG